MIMDESFLSHMMYRGVLPLDKKLNIQLVCITFVFTAHSILKILHHSSYGEVVDIIPVCVKIVSDCKP